MFQAKSDAILRPQVLPPAVSSGKIQFDEFKLDCDSFELLRAGRRLKLERIPMEMLILLAARNGQLVTRQEIIDSIWGSGVFLDTDHGINTAIRKIRNALHDDPEQPRFVQTVTGKGYRFIAPTTTISSSPGNGSLGPARSTRRRLIARSRRLNRQRSVRVAPGECG